MNRVWIKRIIIGLVILLLLAVTAFGSFFAGIASGLLVKAQATTLDEEIISGEDEEDKIGIIRFEGLILTSGSDSPLNATSVITSGQVKRWLRELAQDENLKALIIEVNSPGGSPVAADQIYQALQSFNKNGKSTIVVMEDVAASGAYYFSAAADKIIANPATLTGSIGVITEITNLEVLLEKIGIDIETYKGGEFKDITSISRPRTDEEKEIIQEYVDTAYDLFITRVAEGRNMDEKLTRSLAEGKIYSGKKAFELKLIDKLGSVEDAIEEAKLMQNLDQVKIVRYKTSSPLDILLGKVGSAINPLSSILNNFSSPGLKVSYLPAF